MSIRTFLTDLGLEQYSDKFESNDITVEVLKTISDEDLKEVGVDSLGHRRKILMAIGGSGQSPPIPAVSPTSHPNVVVFDGEFGGRTIRLNSAVIDDGQSQIASNDIHTAQLTWVKLDARSEDRWKWRLKNTKNGLVVSLSSALFVGLTQLFVFNDLNGNRTFDLAEVSAGPVLILLFAASVAALCTGLFVLFRPMPSRLKYYCVEITLKNGTQAPPFLPTLSKAEGERHIELVKAAGYAARYGRLPDVAGALEVKQSKKSMRSKPGWGSEAAKGLIGGVVVGVLVWMMNDGHISEAEARQRCLDTAVEFEADGEWATRECSKGKECSLSIAREARSGCMDLIRTTGSRETVFMCAVTSSDAVSGGPCDPLE